jgi:hypothetical protein
MMLRSALAMRWVIARAVARLRVSEICGVWCSGRRPRARAAAWDWPVEMRDHPLSRSAQHLKLLDIDEHYHGVAELGALGTHLSV